jgi:uncharacterized protein (TIGR02145 family)
MRVLGALRGASASITNSVINLLAILLASAAFAACSTDEPETLTPSRLVPVPITLTTEKPDYYGGTPPADSRAIDWEAINNLDILVFNGETRIYRRYFTSSELGQGMTLDVPEGTGLVAYAFANVANTVFDNIKTLTDLNSSTCTIAAWNTMDSWNDIPMSGRSDPFTVSLGQSSTGPSISFVLRRIAAKLNITLTEGTGVTFKTMKVVNLPKKTYYVSRPLTTERSLADATDDSGRIGGKDAVVPATPTDWIAESATLSSKSVSLYMFENRPGVTANTNQAAKGKANAPDTRCTHLVITGEDSNNTYEWTFYLGGDPTSNYNIKRNSVYTITATLKNSSVSDVRVVAVAKKWELDDDGAARGSFAGSNIYWDGSKLTFDGAGSTSKQYYQGVYFKWGSLVGISPAAQGSGTGKATWSGAETIYTTTAYNGPATDGGTKPTWNVPASANTIYASYADIPYESGGFTTYDTSQDHLNYSASTKTSKWSAYKGDICRYLGEIGAAPSGYRMPRDEEFVSGGFTRDGSFANDAIFGTANGQTNLSAKGYAKTRADLRFPITGNRNASGLLYYITAGSYWSSSARNADQVFHLFFDGSSIYTSQSINRQQAFSVRCIKD